MDTAPPLNLSTSVKVEDMEIKEEVSEITFTVKEAQDNSVEENDFENGSGKENGNKEPDQQGNVNFKQESQLVAHKEKDYVCLVCSTVFTRASLLRAHERSHSEEQNIMAGHLDTELLIVEVEKRPALWDISAEEYKDKNKKMQAWVEVCQSLIEGYEEKSTPEKNSIGNDVQNKWKNLRDAYAKDCKKENERRSGSGAVKARRYIFSEQLSFLKKVIVNRITANSLSSDHTPGEVSQETPQDSATGQTVTRPRTSEKRKRLSLEDRMIQFMDGREQQEADDDKYFLMSILPSVKSLNADDKLQFRIQVMQLLMNFRQYRPPFERQRYPDPFPVSQHNPQPIPTQMFGYHNIPTNSHSHHNYVPSTSQTTQDTLLAGQQTHPTVCSPAACSPASDTSHVTDNSALSLFDL